MAFEPLGPFSPTEGVERAVAAAALVAATLVAAWLLHAQRLLRRAERSTWWASSGRDLLNGLALAGITAALAVMGFTVPAAVTVGATFFLAQSFAALATRSLSPRMARSLAVAVALLVASPAMVAPERVAAWANTVARSALRLPEAAPEVPGVRR